VSLAGLPSPGLKLSIIKGVIKKIVTQVVLQISTLKNHELLNAEPNPSPVGLREGGKLISNRWTG